MFRFHETCSAYTDSYLIRPVTASVAVGLELLPPPHLRFPWLPPWCTHCQSTPQTQDSLGRRKWRKGLLASVSGKVLKDQHFKSYELNYFKAGEKALL